MSRSMQLAKERAKCPTCGQRPRLEPRTKRGLASAIRSENAALRALAAQLAEALEEQRAKQMPYGSPCHCGIAGHAPFCARARAALAAAQRAGLTR